MEKPSSNMGVGDAASECLAEDESVHAKTFRYWLIDDDDKYRTLQSSLLDMDGGLICTGSYGSADAALQALPTEESPELILMDVNMPGTNGIDAIPLVQALAPRARVIIISNFPDAFDKHKAIRAGASGCLSKTCTSHELASAISTAIAQPFTVVPVAPRVASQHTAASRASLQNVGQQLGNMVKRLFRARTSIR